MRLRGVTWWDQSVKILVFTSEFTVLLLAVGKNLYKVLWLSDGKDFNFCKELLFLCVSSNPFVQEVSREWRL